MCGTVNYLRPGRSSLMSRGLFTMSDVAAAYIVREDGFDEQVALLCPCGCGRVLQMNLLPDERPCWRVMRNADRTVTLDP